MGGKRILPPTYFLSYLIAGFVLHRVLPITQLIGPPLTYLGVPLILTGLGVNLWGAGLFRAKGTAIKPFEASSVLVTEGPFRFSRNPMYVGGVTVLLGTAVLLGSVTAFLAPVAMFLTLQKHFILAEEAMLEATFGESYRQYKARVRRWI